MPRRFPLAFALFAVLLPLALPAFSARAQASPARFEGAPCMFDLPRSAIEGKDVTCGYAIVPEIHANPAGPTIKLAVAIFKSPAPTRATDANIYLEGGPGGDVAQYVRRFYDLFTRDFVGERDFILFDQRGVGKSQPALTCPETAMQTAADNAARLTYNESTTNYIAALGRCRDRLAAAGVNLNAYRSSENAADVNDIRAVLGYSTLNLIGTSYGTRLALTVMRDFPRAVRSAVLDSNDPPEANLSEDWGRNHEAVLKEWFDYCEKSTSCNDRFPNLRANFAEAYVRLNAKPVTITIKDSNTGNTRTTVLLNGDNFIADAISDLSRGANGFLSLARTVTALQRDDFVIEDETVEVDLPPARPQAAGFATLMHWATNCAEEMPFNNRDVALANAQKLMFELREWAVQGVRTDFEVCARFGVTPAGAIETRPVMSNTPALVLSAEADPATPRRYSTITARSLSRSYAVSLPVVGHGAFLRASSCGISVVYNFINTPTQRPNTSCTRDL